MLDKRVSFIMGMLVVTIMLFTVISCSPEWPQWRGPDRDGVVKTFSVPDAWPDSLRRVWSVTVGSGYSSPVAANGKVYLHTREGEDEFVSCFSMNDGELLWQESYAAPFTANWFATSHGKGPYSTPVVKDGRLYSLGISGVLSCFDAKSGELKWRKNYFEREIPKEKIYVCTPCRSDCDAHEYDQPGLCPVCNMGLVVKGVDTSGLYIGTAMSPLVDGDKGIIHVGDADRGTLVAFDVGSGEMKWEWNEAAPGYVSPILVELAGIRQIVTITQNSCVGISIASGELLWSFPFEDVWNENIVTPVNFEDTMIISGKRHGTVAIRIKRANDGWSTEEVWKNPEIAMYMSSPVLVEDKLYGLSAKRKGQFFCIDARTGETLWTSTGREGKNAAIVSAGDVMLALTTDAKLTVFEQDADAYKPLKKYSVAESSTWAHPAFVGNRLLIKDASHLTFWSFE